MKQMWLTLHIYLNQGCSGAKCSRTWDLINDVRQNTESTIDPTALQSGNNAEISLSTNSTGNNWKGLSRDLIEAIRSQSLLGALVGILVLIITVLTTAWIWTCCVLKKRMAKENNTVTESVQTRYSYANPD